MDTAVATRPSLDALFEEARRRARRRRLIASAAVIAAAAVATLVLGSRETHPTATSGHVPGPIAVAPRSVLARPPYVGLACPRPNSTACDRVGVAIWTKQRATSARASINGRPLALDDPHWSGPARHGLRRMFAGFLQPAGLAGRAPARYTGAHPVSLHLRLVITRADGSRRATTLTLVLAPGWG